MSPRIVSTAHRGPSEQLPSAKASEAKPLERQLRGICRCYSWKGPSTPLYQTPCFIGEEMETQSYDLSAVSGVSCIPIAEATGVCSQPCSLV